MIEADAVRNVGEMVCDCDYETVVKFYENGDLQDDGSIPEDGFYKPTHAVEPGSKTTCHSFVKAGQWEFLGDCTHHLKGQTVAATVPPDGWPWTEEGIR